MRGKVKWFDTDKGYGFIKGENKKDYFAHINNVAGSDYLTQDDDVEFEASQGPRGLIAQKIRMVAKLILLAIMVSGLLGGCGIDRATADHRAAVMNGIANQINAKGLPTDEQDKLDFAWAIENERRAAVNLADAYHWRDPSYAYPAKRPTAFPWTPEDDVSTE